MLGPTRFGQFGAHRDLAMVSEEEKGHAHTSLLYLSNLTFFLFRLWGLRCTNSKTLSFARLPMFTAAVNTGSRESRQLGNLHLSRRYQAAKHCSYCYCNFHSASIGTVFFSAPDFSAEVHLPLAQG